MPSKEQLLERERRWALIAGIASVAGVALILASFGSSASGVRTVAGVADRLIEVDADRSGLVIASVIQCIGWFLLAVPLVYLFKAAAARAPQVRSGLIGLVIVAPIFLGLGGLLSAASVLDAATEFKATPDSEIQACVAEKQDEQATDDAATDEDATTTDELVEECRDDIAGDDRTGSSVSGIETGLGLAGLLGFTIAVVYCALWGMRTGLLTRFWGSLGLALGAVFVFFTLFTLVWFIYLGLLFAGWVPGGRPPAWAAGEAMPLPKPGRRGDSDPDEPGGPDDGGPGGPDDGGPGGGVLEGFGEPVEDRTDLEPESAPEPSDAPQIERRKRKKRDS
jgi:hypothetical protein